MPYTQHDEDIHQQFEDDLRNLVENYIGHFGGYGSDQQVGTFLHDGHYRRIKKTFQDVTEEAIQRFQRDGERRRIWPYNDQKLKMIPKFEIIFDALLRQVFERTDEEVNQEIKLHGGKPFRHTTYDSENKFGNVVVEPDYKAMKLNTGIAKSTAEKIVRKMERAGVLTKIDRGQRAKTWYIIGDWQKFNGGFSVNLRLNRQTRREANERGLLSQGLAKRA